MATGREENDAGKGVELALRRQASSAQNRRDLGRLPQFHVEHDLPDDMAQLLRRMERAERHQR